MPIYWNKTRKRWAFEFSRRIDGNRVRVTKLLPQGWRKTQAEAYDRATCASLFAQAAGVESPKLTVAGAVQLYLDHRLPQLRNRKKTALELAQLYDEIRRTPLEGVAALATRYELRHRGKLAPATIRNRLAYLRAAITYAYRVHGYGDHNHADRMVLPSPNNERQVYAKLPELNRLWAAFEDAEAAALFKAAFYMGLRWRSELLPRQPADVIENDGQTWLVIGHTKNGLPTMKPVHPAARECLNRLPWAWKDQYYYARWRQAVARIGRKDLRPHDLRHSLASEIRARGGTLEDIQGALHQVSRQSAQRYAHLYPERLRAVMLAVGEKIPYNQGEK